ncbi:5818_t:CDS:2, partial [Gigaspora margarita]
MIRHVYVESYDDDVQHAVAELDDDDDVQNAVAELDDNDVSKESSRLF